MRLLFVGVGNMGGAVLEGIVSAQFSDLRDIKVLNATEASSRKTAERFGVGFAETLTAGLEWANCVVLAIKPQVYRHILPELKTLCNNAKGRKIFISVMAGVTLSTLQNDLGDQHRFIRTMPNLPMTVGFGTTTVANNQLQSEEMALIKKLFEPVSRVVFLPESLLNAATAVAGSGPAWVFEMAEGWIRAGVHEGLPRNIAQELVYSTLLGSAHLLQKSGSSPSDLTAQVCSPGGTTIHGVQALEENGFKASIAKAVFAAHQRAKDLG
jgi:pyrroline-5-carboxylate reductase